jgi:hypothetical protein
VFCGIHIFHVSYLLSLLQWIFTGLISIAGLFWAESGLCMYKEGAVSADFAKRVPIWICTVKSVNVFIHLGLTAIPLLLYLYDISCGEYMTRWRLNYYNEVSSLTDEDQDVLCGDKGDVKQFLRTWSQHEVLRNHF